MKNPGLVRTGFPYHFSLLEPIQLYILGAIDGDRVGVVFNDEDI
jgi:hypothetical protein